MGSPASLRADLLSLPEEGGGFRVGDFVGPELGAFCRADPAALEDRFIAELAASLVHSGVRLDEEEYVKVLKRLLEVGMLEFTATASEYPLKLFAVWKVVGEIQRLIMDGRVPNCFFLTPSMEHTSGDDLARMQVAEDRLLEVAKSDLSDHFHRCEALAALRA